MVRIGITGATGAGKGTVAEILAKKNGFLHIDADYVYHELLNNSDTMREEIIKEFGTLDTALILEQIRDEEKHVKLNTITHKYVIEKIEELEKNHASNTIIDAALLIESGFNKTCNVTIAVIADKDIRVNRIITRDGLNFEQAEERISIQHSNEFYSEKADVTIENNGSLSELEKECEKLLSKQLLEFC